MSTYFTSGFVAAALAVWFTLAAWGQVGEKVGQGVPAGPLPPNRAGKTEPTRSETPGKAGDPVREKVRDAERINEQLKEARDGNPVQNREDRREAREDAKARVEAQQKADEARPRAARGETPLQRAEEIRDARIRAEAAARDRRDDRRDHLRDQDYVAQPNRGDQNFFRPSAIRSADIGLWFDPTDRKQLIISDIAATGAIAKLGFREGDRILAVNKRRIVSQPDFLQYLFADDLRTQKVEVLISRDGREEVVWVEPNTLVEDYYHVDNDPLEHFGVIVDDRYDDRIVVWRVIPRSPAYYAGIRPGDMFVTFQGDKIANRAALIRTLQGVPEGEVEVQVRRGTRLRDFRVEVPAYVARTDRRVYLKPEVERVVPPTPETDRTIVAPVPAERVIEPRPTLPGVTPISPPTEAIPKVKPKL